VKHARYTKFLQLAEARQKNMILMSAACLTSNDDKLTQKIALVAWRRCSRRNLLDKENSRITKATAARALMGQAKMKDSNLVTKSFVGWSRAPRVKREAAYRLKEFEAQQQEKLREMEERKRQLEHQLDVAMHHIEDEMTTAVKIEAATKSRIARMMGLLEGMGGVHLRGAVSEGAQSKNDYEVGARVRGAISEAQSIIEDEAPSRRHRSGLNSRSRSSSGTTSPAYMSSGLPSGTLGAMYGLSPMNSAGALHKISTPRSLAELRTNPRPTVTTPEQPSPPPAWLPPGALMDPSNGTAPPQAQRNSSEGPPESMSLLDLVSARVELAKQRAAS